MLNSWMWQEKNRDPCTSGIFQLQLEAIFEAIKIFNLLVTPVGLQFLCGFYLPVSCWLTHNWVMLLITWMRWNHLCQIYGKCLWEKSHSCQNTCLWSRCVFTLIYFQSGNCQCISFAVFCEGEKWNWSIFLWDTTTPQIKSWLIWIRCF